MTIVSTAQEYHQLGCQWFQRENFSEAQTALEKAISLGSNDDRTYYYLALISQKQGKSEEAENLYRQAIKLNPDSPVSYNNLGVVLKERGLLEEAQQNYLTAISLNSNYAIAYNNLGNLLREKGSLEEAEKNYHQAIALNPNYSDAYNNLGSLLAQKGSLEEAEKNYRQAIALNPNYSDAYNNLGSLLAQKSSLEEAEKNYRQAIALNPNYSDAYNNLGLLLAQKDLLEEAEKNYRQAITLNPNYSDAYNNLGLLLQEKGLLEEAEEKIRQAIVLNPQSSYSYFCLAFILEKQNLLDEAKQNYHQAIALNPNYGKAYTNFGNLLLNLGLLTEAQQNYRQAIALENEQGPTNFNLGFLLLLIGNFQEGWKGYEWRLKLDTAVFPKTSQPGWDGSDIRGKTIVLMGEQGLGDAIQFIRYVPILAQQGATVKVICNQSLVSIFRTIEGIKEVIVQEDQEITTPHNYYVFLMSLPYILGTTLETIPRNIPYIKCDDRSLSNNQIPASNFFKIGIVWGSNKYMKALYKNKSCDLELFIKLLSIPEIALYSLQVGPDAGDIEKHIDNKRVFSLSPLLKDFSDTAAVIEQLDLVITVDTAVAHLAGAMGKPVWTLLPFSPDWRWLLERNDSPWYPTMRLFRQPQRGDWTKVFLEVEKELVALLKIRRKAPQAKNESAQDYHQLGIKLVEQKNFVEAEVAFRKAIKLGINSGITYYNLGAILQTKGELEKAENLYFQAINLSPSYAPSYNNLGTIFKEKGLLREAEENYRQAIFLNPKYATAYNNLGNILKEKSLLDDAQKHYQQAISLNSKYEAPYNNLGNVLREKGLLDEAQKHYQQAISLKGKYEEPHNNLGNILREKGFLEQAQNSYHQAIAINPSYVDAHFNLSLLLLTIGDWERGWKEYEWRCKFKNIALPQSSQPKWDGGDIRGKTIVLITEQGLGDSIQFIRYAPILAQKGAIVKVICDRALVSLFQSIEGIKEVMPNNSKEIMTKHDTYLPLMSSPYLLETRLNNIPSSIPYIFTRKQPAIKIDIPVDTSLKIGIVWASQKDTQFYKQKTCPLELFVALLSIPSITLYSLQVGPDAGDIEKYLKNDRLFDLSLILKDFTDTVAVIEQLDLVITVDTAVAHLAGAMGKPVWTLLPFMADWRWLLERRDSPWYPTMRLFRQLKRDDWVSVFGQVQNQLSVIDRSYTTTDSVGCVSEA